jgi:hypothetical protein
MSARATTPYHCPFCGEEDLRPVEDDAQAVAAWVCRACARVFTVTLVRIDRTLVPGHVAASEGRQS